MARRNKILAGIAAAIILILVAVVVFLATLDANRFKPFVEEKASAALGRQVAINGDLRLEWRRPEDEHGWRAWIPWAELTAGDISVANTDWGKAPKFATLKQLQFQVGLLPLLTHRVALRHIQLGEPAVNLERLADGRANWEFQPQQDQDKDADKQPSAWALDVREIAFDKGTVAYLDATRQADVQVVVDPLGKPISIANLAGAEIAGDLSGSKRAASGSAAQPAQADGKGQGGQAGQAGQSNPAGQPGQPGASDAYVFGWQAKGKYKGLPVDAQGKVGGVLALQDTDKPFPLEVKAALGHTKASAVGTLTNPTHLGALDLRLTLSGASMADLFPLIGVALPDTPPYSTDGRLVGRLNEPQGAVYEYRGFNGKVGDSDIHGDLTFTDSKPRPRLQGQFTSNLLRFADLGPLVGADTGKGSGGKADSDSAKVAKAERASGQATDSGKTPSDQPADKALPVQEFRTDRWNAMDADVSLKAKRIVQTADLPITDLQVRAVMQNGALALTPLRFGMAGGTLDADIHLDGSKKPMPGRAKISARRLQLPKLFPKVESMKRSLGELNGDVALSGTGNSVAALLATANGETKILINDGVISASLMELAGLNVGNYIVARLFGDQEVPINCAAADVKVKDGLATPDLFVFDTENAVINIDGSVNFKNEAIDLDITPHSKGLRIISLRSPLYVDGTLKNPKAGVKVAPLLARGAGMVALGAVLTPAAGLLALIVPSNSGAENQCSTLLQQMKQPPKAPPPKPAAKARQAR
ncbi:AsmA family protein [Bordetella genomosp. 9]|uniref:AsmA family protein n=1 Tax=Bordetella genomosp. 9 TaxID=1416803 RepID=A0A261R4Q4_9BORD|nr:AsmA family protein [Bordetella genomosp. 9]OZI20005.1 AsmA family protein [Bordetella genomosp. 9]